MNEEKILRFFGQIGALFYVGYSYRAIEEIKELRESFQKLEKRVAKLEK